MAVRTRSIGTKLVVLQSDLHSRLKRVCFEKEIRLKDLLNLMVSTVLNDPKMLEEFVAELQAGSE